MKYITVSCKNCVSLIFCCLFSLFAAYSYAGLKPLGANLFNGKFSAQPVSGINNEYTIMPGDRISISIWGIPHPVENAVLPVDLHGNIFLPDVGPVKVGGVQNSNLNNAISSQVKKIYTGNVKIYSNLITAQPVGIFVTGYVNNPGQYSGTHSDSVLYYLDAAGGIDNEQGSYRNISIVRKDKVIAKTDLYDFILHGKINIPQLKSGDKILVGVKGASIKITGSLKNPSFYELKNKEVQGSDLLSMLSMHSGTNKVSISGIENDKPFHKYINFSEFNKVKLQDGDNICFVRDNYKESIFVNLKGEIKNQKRFSLRKGSKLSNVIEKIEVNKELVDIDSVYIVRKSVADQQKQALTDALARLEKTVYTTDSYTDTGAAIKTKEAQLVSQYVEKAKNIQPEGRLVIKSNGIVQDLLLEEDDTIVLPSKTDAVMVSGEVNIPTTVLYNKGMRVLYYLEKAAGVSANGDSGKVIIIRASGELLMGSRVKVMPGDHIIVMPKLRSKTLQVLKDLTQVAYQLAASAHYFVKKTD